MLPGIPHRWPKHIEQKLVREIDRYVFFHSNFKSQRCKTKQNITYLALCVVILVLAEAFAKKALLKEFLFVADQMVGLLIMKGVLIIFKDLVAGCANKAGFMPNGV